MELSGRKVVVVGLARSGLAVARFLSVKGARVTVTDRASETELGDFVGRARRLGVELALGGHPQTTMESADLVVISPGVPHTIEPLVQVGRKGIPVIGEVELASRFIRKPILAVSGTNGKTTTTELLGRMMAAAGKRVYVGGNIGSPLIDIADRDTEIDAVVAEISSFQLDTAQSFRPHVAVLLNITPDHLDRYPSMAAYADAKGRLFMNQEPQDFAICNGGDDLVQGQCGSVKSRLLNFFSRPCLCGGPGQGAIITPRQIALIIPEVAEGRIELGRIRLIGPHNRENIAAASLAALAAGADLASIQKALDDFPALPHRLERVGTVNEVQFVNDSKATNVDAVVRALECFEGPVILIMGGRNKGYDFAPLHRHVKARVKRLIAIGESRHEIMAALQSAPDQGAEMAEDMADAVRRANAAADPGDTVLLSPACASFDMFANYAERGDVFRRSVGDLV